MKYSHHHNLLNKGVSNKLVTLLIISFGLTFLLIGIVLEYTFPEFSFLVFSILFLFYLFLRFNDLPMRKDKEC